MSSLDKLVWEQKYRPSKIDDCILPAETKKMIKELISNDNVPSMLFSGSGGVGKTTLAKAIASELDADMLFINASLENGIDTIRTTIAQFVSSVSFSGGKKIVLLDEADYLNSNSSQPAMRGFLDEFSSNAIFILTCNFKNRIIAPLISRLQVVDFKFSKEDKSSATIHMLKRAIHILTEEGVEFDKKAVASIVSKNFPDFRKTIGELQRWSSSGKIDSDILAASGDTGIEDLITFVKEKNFTKCRQWVANSSMDATSFYRTIYDKMLPVMVPQTIPPVILLIAESQFRASHSIDQEINSIAFLVQLMSTAQFK
jgi:DNA polymerase III delta prime subunit